MSIKVWIHMKGPDIETIVISGHADSNADDESKWDLVCAQVSAVGVGILNSMESQCPDACQMVMDEGYISLHVNKPSPVAQIILKTLQKQLETIAYVNAQYIQIEIEKMEV